MRLKGESQEQMLSRMAEERDAREAAKRDLTVDQLHELQRTCTHSRIIPGHYVDSCDHCDKAMPA